MRFGELAEEHACKDNRHRIVFVDLLLTDQVANDFDAFVSAVVDAFVHAVANSLERVTDIQAVKRFCRKVEDDVACVIADDVVHAFNAVRAVEHGDVDGKISAFAESCERFQVKVEENYAGSDAVFAGGDFHFAERFLAECFLDAVADVGFAVVCAYNGEFGRCGNIGFETVPKFSIAIVLCAVLSGLNPFNILRIAFEVE